MSRAYVHWIPVTTGLPANSEENVLVVIRPPDNCTEHDPEDRWMEWGLFDPGMGWHGEWLNYLGEGFVVTHWAVRPDFPF